MLAIKPPEHVTDAGLRTHFGYRLKRCFNVVSDDLAKVLAPFELRMVSYTALMLINENPGLRPSQLAGAIAIERSNLVLILDELEARGWVRKHRSAADRRALALNLTPSGNNLLKRANAAVLAHEARLMADVSQELRKAAEAAMDLIEKAS